MGGWRATGLTAALAVAVGLGGCVTNPVGRVSDPGVYADKARRTVEDAASAAETTRTVVHAELTDRSFRSYTARVVDDALTSLDTAESTFEAIVPPDEDSRHQRGQVLDAVAGARRAVTDVLTALPGDDAALTAAAGALDPAIDQLQGVEEELG